MDASTGDHHSIQTLCTRSYLCGRLLKLSPHLGVALCQCNHEEHPSLRSDDWFIFDRQREQKVWNTLPSAIVMATKPIGVMFDG
jgi:hypothetical protein